VVLAVFAIFKIFAKRKDKHSDDHQE
jgi:hypothetical protein